MMTSEDICTYYYYSGCNAKKGFGNFKPKSGKTDPDVWFNELESLKMRLVVMGSVVVVV